MSNERVFIHCQLVTIVSVPAFKNRKRGKRLIINAYFTAVFTCVRAQVLERGEGLKVVSRGKMRRRMASREAEAMRLGIKGALIYHYLDLHQEFLVPKTNG